MGLFGFVHRPGTDEGVQKFKSTAGAVLLDVRTQAEYASGHIPGAVNLPLDRVGAEAAERFDVNTPLFVYCRSGARSSQATAILKDSGFNAENIGGIINYHGEVEK